MVAGGLLDRLRAAIDALVEQHRVEVLALRLEIAELKSKINGVTAPEPKTEDWP